LVNYKLVIEAEWIKQACPGADTWTQDCRSERPMTQVSEDTALLLIRCINHHYSHALIFSRCSCEQ